jgi:hypothetical protein
MYVHSADSQAVLGFKLIKIYPLNVGAAKLLKFPKYNFRV